MQFTGYIPHFIESYSPLAVYTCGINDIKSTFEHLK
jgi:hypothetical protein